jgi:thymidylate synthase
VNYKEIVQNVLQNGVPKQPTRMENGMAVAVENGTIGTFCEIFRHNMAEGFPLSTLRKLPFRSICVELEGFIKGITTKGWFQDRECKFWNEWANPKAVKNIINEMKEASPSKDGWDYSNERCRKKVQKAANDLGPIYGYQWRSFDQHYPVTWDGYGNTKGQCEWANRIADDWEVNGVQYGTDQLKNIVNTLKSNPYDRRMVCSAWNPNQMHLMALPPCHYSWGVVVYGDKLNLHWNQRSVDSSHGLPCNIASYGLLMMLLCEESGLQPGELVGKLEDCHLYDNTIGPMQELVSREEKELPQMKIKRKTDGKFSIFDWEYTDVELIGYDPHPAINVGAVTV